MGLRKNILLERILRNRLATVDLVSSLAHQNFQLEFQHEKNIYLNGLSQLFSSEIMRIK
jgi:hypothetical protein